MNRWAVSIPLAALCAAPLSTLGDAVSESAPAPVATITLTTEDVTHWVDPFMGTAADTGQLHPAATWPFGMVQLGPETPGRSHSGYDFESETFLGFSHTRTAGVGCRGAGGNILMRADYASHPVGSSLAFAAVRLDKASEVASPGYYSVQYGQPAVRAEMTVSPSSGWQRYTFSEPGEVLVTLNVAHAHHQSYGGSYRVEKGGGISGEVNGATVCKEGRYRYHFSLVPATEPDSVEPVDSEKLQLRYSVTKGQTLEFHTGISSVDAATAEQARLADADVGSFDAARSAAQVQWRTILGQVQVNGTVEDKQLFYSHLYQLYQSPSNLTDSVGRYRASDNRVYEAGARNYYFGWSIWDTFRTKLPLLTLLRPREMEDIAASLAQLYTQGKRPWATNTEPLPTVRTEHSAVVLLDAWHKGIRTFDLEALLPVAAQEADAMSRNSPDQVLEAAYDDWAVGRLAAIAGDHALSAKYLQRSTAYRAIWWDKFKHVVDTFDVMHGDGLYEGTLWQYRWFAPHDMPWVVAELGGKGGFNRELQAFFEGELFNMGNQPDIQTPFLFSVTGQPWLTQRTVHRLLNTDSRHWYGTHEKKTRPFIGRPFNAAPRGMLPEMDNDAGTMSGWYLFVSMGLYPVTPGEAVYTLHTPQFRSVRLALAGDATFIIGTDEDPKEYPYIQAAWLNGSALERAWLRHEEIASGGELRLELGKTPNREWGTQALLLDRSIAD